MPSLSDDSSDENPESDGPRNFSSRDEGYISNNRHNNFRIRRGALIDYREDDGYWYIVEVKKVNRQNKSLFISFPNSDANMDKWVYFEQAAPLHSYTYDGNGNFKTGQIVEVLDDDGRWRGAEITDIDPQLNCVKVRFHCGLVGDIEWIRSPRYRIRYCQQPRTRIHYRRWKVPHPGSPNHYEMIQNNHIPSYDYKIDENGREVLPHDHIDQDNHARGFIDNSHKRRIDEFSDHYAHYINTLSSQNLSVIPVTGDGNCLFRAVAHQVYGDESLQSLVREKCMNYMEAEAEFFSQFVEGGIVMFPRYLSAKRLSGCWGDDPEIQALCEIYDRPAEIWAYDATCGAKKLRTFHEAAATRHRTDGSPHTATTIPQRPSMKLSYYGGGHYDSIVDAYYRSNLLNVRPGVVEEAALARAKSNTRSRSTNQASQSSSNGHIPTALSGPMEKQGYVSSNRDLEDVKQVSDIEETDRSALDLAIQISRSEQHLGWAVEDLDTSLLIALGLDKSNKMCVSNDYKAESKGLSESPSKVKLDGKNDMQLTGEALHDTVNDIAAVQRDILQTVAQESELEYLDKAIISSVADSDDADAKIIEEAKLESLKAFDGMSEEEILERARQESLKDGKVLSEDEILEKARLESLKDLKMDPEVQLALNYAELDEEQLLRLAIEQSYQGHINSFSLSAGNTSSNAVTNSDASKNDMYMDDNLDEDEMLQAALQQSLQGINSFHIEGKDDGRYHSNDSNIADEIDDEELLMQAIQESLRK